MPQRKSNSLHHMLRQNQATYSTTNSSILHRKKLSVTMPSTLQWFTVAQISHAKCSAFNLLWTCPKHGFAIAEIVAPPPPILERLNRPSAASKLCSVCSTHILPSHADLAYHCADSLCLNVCHLFSTCSGFPIPRGEARQRELATRIWKCHLHISPVVNTPIDIKGR